MFSTFRHQKSESGDDQYVVESTASPFDRSSHRISRLACVYCRSKNVKCTGEEHGCQRCLDKQLVCSYTSPSRPETETVPRRLPRMQHIAKNVDAGVLRLGDDIAAIHDKSEKSLNIETHLAQDSVMANSDLWNIELDLVQSAMGQDAYSLYGNSSFLSFDAFPTIDAATPTSTIADKAANPSPPTHRANEPGSGEIVESASSSTIPSPIPNPDHANNLCSEILKVYETVEVGLARAQLAGSMGPSVCITRPIMSPSPEPNDELACQKEVLRSCEKWLSCDASRIQSQHAMLMVSILDRLLASILSMAKTPNDGNGGDLPIPPVSPEKSSSYIGGRVWSLRDPQNTKDPRMFIAEADYSLHTDKRRIEDEERIHVLKSLLDFRASRLKGLLERLGAIAASNQWQMQTIMVQNLLERLTSHRELL